MYARRLQLANCGPIGHLDIAFPFEDDTPKPVLLIGENGSGKSILLSHIVNALQCAKTIAYPDTPEVETGKVYKLRSSSYVKSGSEYYFARVDFEEGLSVTEIQTQKLKQEYECIPAGLSDYAAQDAWNMMKPQKADYFDSRTISNNQSKIENLFSKRCVLHFPPNRFEEPAWLNEENLKAQAQYMDLKHVQGQTDRKVINYSPLHDNQNWLFDLLYDRHVLELQTSLEQFHLRGSDQPIVLPLFLGYSGSATSTYEIALQIVRTITRRQDARFGIGERNYRVVSLTSDLTGQIVHNIFQLSSGETSLLNLFLSIVRDFGLCGAPFSNAADVRGIVVVDEIDLHLHAVHQYEILPELIKMFPNVQFVVTTHSPLFVLGMQRVFGEDSFALYRLPQGRRISPEEFNEFEDAYRAFTETVRFSGDLSAAIEGAQKSILFVEGSTDQKYIQKASQLLGKEAMLQQIEIRDGGGHGNLDNIWKLRGLPGSIVQQKVMLLYDCEKVVPFEDKGGFLRRVVPRQSGHPIEKGIENLFGKVALEKARQHKSAFIDCDPGRTKTVRGELVDVQDVWTINENEKANLCNWLCENGTEEDFQGFQVIFKLLEDLVKMHPSLPGEVVVAEQASSENVADSGGAANCKESL